MHRGVPVHTLAFVASHCARCRRNGQAELTFVSGCIFDSISVCKPSIIRLSTDRFLVISLTETNAIPLSPNVSVFAA